MKSSDKIREWIKRWEGLRLQAYLCPSGVWTIGYGHTEGVKRGQTIDVKMADELFAGDVAKFDVAVTEMADRGGVKLAQGQFDALVSFAFNAGVGALEGSTLWRKCKRDVTDETIADEFGRWVYGTVDGKKQVLAGLVNRRKGEAKSWRGEL